jgi:hypothetical protein
MSTQRRRRKAVSLACVGLLSLLIYFHRAGQPQAHPCPTPRSVHRLIPGKPSPDDGPCSLRDNNLGGSLAMLLHSSFRWLYVRYYIHAPCYTKHEKNSFVST